MRGLINKIGLMMLLAVFGFGTVWGANSSATFDLCVGDVVNIYENHGNPYTMKLDSNTDETVASGVAVPTNPLDRGLFYTVTALKPGSTTIVFKRYNKAGTTLQSTETYTVNVSAARQVEIGESVMLTTWGNTATSAKGSSTWTVTPSDPDMVELQKGHDESVASAQVVLTGKTATQGAVETVTCSNVKSNAGSEFIFKMEILPRPTMGVDTIFLQFGESKDCWLAADYASITPVESDYLTVTPDEKTDGKRVTLTAKSIAGSETFRFYDKDGVLLKRVSVTVSDPDALTLCFTESKEYTFTTPNGETAEWNARAANSSSGVKLLVTTNSIAREFTGIGSNFTFRIVASGAASSDTITVTRTIDGSEETVATFSVQSLPDRDYEQADAYTVISRARKQVTLYMGGDPLNFQNYCGSAKLWRFCDADLDASNFNTNFKGYTGTNVYTATTSKVYNNEVGKNYTKSSYKDFDVAIKAQRVGAGMLTILFGGSDQRNPYHYAGYYDVFVRDVPQADGAITGSSSIEEGQPLGRIGVSGRMIDTAGNEVKGGFAWCDETQIVGKPIGPQVFQARFVPQGDALSEFYDAVTVDVTVEVTRRGTIISFE